MKLYCPVHNLENADAGYEWLFNGLNDYYIRTSRMVDGRKVHSIEHGTLSKEQEQISRDLKNLFPDYVNALILRDENGRSLTLNSDGEGSFKDWLKEQVLGSLKKEWSSRSSQTKVPHLMANGSRIDDLSWLKTDENGPVDFDWDAFIHTVTRMKPVPAFDALDLSCPENEEFGDETTEARHFTPYSFLHHRGDPAKKRMADDTIIELMNPVREMEKGNDIAPFFRIRHGSFDRDISLPIPAILALKAKEKGSEVDYQIPWGLIHSGDYDFDEENAWIRDCCQKFDEKKVK